VGIGYSPIERLRVKRGKDRNARDGGQWGTALRWLGDNTEYGAYFMNYHSRTPFRSMKNAPAAALNVGLIGGAAQGIYNTLGISQFGMTGWSTMGGPGGFGSTSGPFAGLSSQAMTLAGAAVAVGNGQYIMD